MSADELKAQGNKAFAAKDYDTAIDFFSKGLAIDPSNHVLWSNRSAAKAGKKEWAAALEDAEQVCLSPRRACDTRSCSSITRTAVHQGQSHLVEGVRAQGRCAARLATIRRCDRGV